MNRSLRLLLGVVSAVIACSALGTGAWAQRPPSEYMKERDGRGNLVGFGRSPISITHAAIELDEEGKATIRLFDRAGTPFVFRGTWRGNRGGEQASIVIERGMRQQDVTGKGTIWFGPNYGIKTIALSGDNGRRRFTANFEADSPAGALPGNGVELEYEGTGAGRAGTSAEKALLDRVRVRLDADGRASITFFQGRGNNNPLPVNGRWIKRGSNYLITIRRTPGEGHGTIFMSGRREIDHIELEAENPMGDTWRCSFIITSRG